MQSSTRRCRRRHFSGAMTAGKRGRATAEPPVQNAAPGWSAASGSDEKYGERAAPVRSTAHRQQRVPLRRNRAAGTRTSSIWQLHAARRCLVPRIHVVVRHEVMSQRSSGPIGAARHRPSRSAGRRVMVRMSWDLPVLSQNVVPGSCGRSIPTQRAFEGACGRYLGAEDDASSLRRNSSSATAASTAARPSSARTATRCASSCARTRGTAQRRR